MRTTTDVQAWRGQQLVSGDGGGKIGKIDEIYVDRETGEPKFLAVKTGLFGTNVSFVPIEEAQGAGDDVSVPFTKDQVKDAPNVDADGELSARRSGASSTTAELLRVRRPDRPASPPDGPRRRFDRDGAGHDTPARTPTTR